MFLPYVHNSGGRGNPLPRTALSFLCDDTRHPKGRPGSTQPSGAHDLGGHSSPGLAWVCPSSVCGTNHHAGNTWSVEADLAPQSPPMHTITCTPLSSQQNGHFVYMHISILLAKMNVIPLGSWHPMPSCMMCVPRQSSIVESSLQTPSDPPHSRIHIYHTGCRNVVMMESFTCIVCTSMNKTLPCLQRQGTCHLWQVLCPNLC